MLKQSLTDEIENDTKDMDEEKSLKAASEEQKATAEGDLAETVKELPSVQIMRKKLRHWLRND